MTRLQIPYLSANVSEAVLTSWLKAEGQTVKKGDAVAEITTEKAVFELESPTDGSLIKILTGERSTLPVGYVVALVGAPGEEDPEVEQLNRDCLAQARQVREAPPPPYSGRTDQPVRPPAARTRATPRARKIARERDLDLAVVQAATGEKVVTEKTILGYLDRQRFSGEGTG